MKNHWLIDKIIGKPTGDQWSPLQNEPAYYLIRISNELQENNHLIGVIYNRPFIYILYIIHKKTALNSMLLTVY